MRNKFSSDLKKVNFSEGFYNGFKKIENEGFKSNPPCAKCPLRRFCLWCPSLAFLEKNDEEAALSYVCQLTQKLWLEKGVPTNRLKMVEHEAPTI